jgi:2-keto-4-pentenoate hydratase/2-oxohepta-3-ene-1,7-dioic acid hydratase in catechol pathway
MQLARFSIPGLDGPEACIAVSHASESLQWVDIRAAERLRLQRRGASMAAAARVARALIPGSLTAALETGDAFQEAAQGARSSDDAFLDLAHAELLAPADPPAYRDFMAFEEHFTNTAASRGLKPPPVLFELPASYMGSVQAIIGPGDVVPWPSYTDHFDYELELGIVIARPALNIKPDEALAHVLGVTVLNDFSARDIQRREMEGRLGPSKAKHFATAIGPVITTLDELDLGDLHMRAWINDELWSDNSSSTITWSVPELIAWAATSEPLAAGTVLGTGTVGGGCGLELGRKLQPSDRVRLEISGIGTLENQVGLRPEAGWQPTPRSPSIADGSKVAEVN